MTYDPQTGTVQYRSKKKKGPEVIETFSALDWLARLSTHIPDKWEQMVRYYGWYSNRQRGKRKPAQKGPAESVPVPDPESESDFKN
ncbi:MAG: transposase [Acidobacteria bacterium]|nr:transposase [Acidobacteriota bacterium]